MAVIPPAVLWYRFKTKTKNMSDRDRVRELRAFIAQIPQMRSYGKVMSKARGELRSIQGRVRTRHNIDDLTVTKSGAAQVVIVGPPNIGKSSLLEKLSGVQIKTGDYDFTTIRPTATTIKYDGVELQLVEIPGLIEGAAEGRGCGRAWLSLVKGADVVLLMCDLTADTAQLDTVIRELQKAGAPTGRLLLCNKCDVGAANLIHIKNKYGGAFDVIPVSARTGTNLEVLREKIWSATGLVRVFTGQPKVGNALRAPGKQPEGAPFALPAGSSIARLANMIHKAVAEKFDYARVWGTSAKFPGQRVGLEHVLADRDTVEIHLKR